MSQLVRGYHVVYYQRGEMYGLHSIFLTIIFSHPFCHIENQAMDRVHRIGQSREVRAIRFIMKDSIEKRFIGVQDAKQALGKGSLEKLKLKDRQQAKITAMKDLFQMEENLAAEDWDGYYDDVHDDGSDLKDFIVDDDDEY